MIDQTDWVLVPRDPTPEMVEASRLKFPHDASNDDVIYMTMIAAAPVPPAREPPIAWMYKHKDGRPGCALYSKRKEMPDESDWTETPLYARPPTQRGVAAPIVTEAEPVAWANYDAKGELVNIALDMHYGEGARRASELAGFKVLPLVHPGISEEAVKAFVEKCERDETSGPEICFALRALLATKERG